MLQVLTINYIKPSPVVIIRALSAYMANGLSSREISWSRVFEPVDTNAHSHMKLKPSRSFLRSRGSGFPAA